MPNQSDSPQKTPRLPVFDPRIGLFYLGLLLVLAWSAGVFDRTSHQTIPYSEFKRYLAQGRVLECQVAEDVITGRIRAASDPEAATPDDPEQPEEFDFETVRVDDPKLIEDLLRSEVTTVGVPAETWPPFFGWLIFLVVLIAFWSLVFRRLGTAMQSLPKFGSSTARLIAPETSGVTFDDVAGCEEAKTELHEVVDFLKNPDRYRTLGARIPKGVLLVGPPGTGKTLMARAVAGEAKVPFFSISGSDFVEMFVGVGAARVRDLFKRAKKKAPCIIFLDELDAIGRQRGVHVTHVNDEREQTLNQLLVEMDGFEANAGVILLSATNRPDVLDPALLRPGRFDRQVVVDAPDLAGRLDILLIHARGKPLAADADLETIARETPGFSGADLANTLNEAALLAARRRSDAIGAVDLQEAVEKVIAGPERRSLTLDLEKRRRLAYHEGGHAVAAAFTEHSDPVHKITIVPRGHAALGYTIQLPDDNRYLFTRPQLIDRITGLLGGRAAEEMMLGEISTGAENDLKNATALTRQMVGLYGMGESVGLMHCGASPQAAPGRGSTDPLLLDCSPQTARKIDEEVQAVLDRLYARARAILEEQRGLLAAVADELLQKESLSGEDFRRLVEEESVSRGA